MMHRNGKVKDTYTTGRVAALLGVAPRTVSKWCDTGALPCYRLPKCGSHASDRRIKATDLREFLSARGFPIELIGETMTRVLVFSDDAAVFLPPGGWDDVRSYRANDAFEAGVVAGMHRVAVAVVDVACQGRKPAAAVAKHLAGIGAAVVWVEVEDGASEEAPEGVRAVLCRPFGADELRAAVEGVLP